MNIIDKLKLSQNIALIAGAFCSAVALLLLLNFWQVSKTDPIESAALEALVQRLKQEPNNEELKIEIRNFDLLARKAYFNSQWQVKTGAYLLLFGAIVLGLALRVYYAAKSKIEAPDEKHENEITSRILAQKGIIIVGAVVMVFAVIASFATVNHLNNYDAEAQLAEAETTPEEEGIEVIEVGETPQIVAGRNEQAVAEAAQPESAAGQAVVETPAVEEKKEEPVEKEVEEKPQPKPAAAANTSGLSLSDLQKNHNSFRGPLAQGIVTHKNIPTTWDGAAGTNVKWKTAIPKHGYNSPVIWGNYVFLTGANFWGKEKGKCQAKRGE